jgi:hypothetical protein
VGRGRESLKKFDHERAVKLKRDRKIARRHQKPKRMATNTQIAESGELGKYSSLLNELETDLGELARLHAARAKFREELEGLRLTRARLSESFLDQEAGQAVLVENARSLEDERLILQSSLEAIEPRIHRKEAELHALTPLAIATFGRLRTYVLDCVMESSRQAVRSLLDPAVPVEAAHVDAIAIATPDYVRVSRISLPGVSWTWTRPLDEKPVYWSNLVRPYTEAEIADLRRQTVESLIRAGSELLQAARALAVAAGPYAEGVPAFKCEPEPPAQPVSAVPPEWNQPINPGLFNPATPATLSAEADRWIGPFDLEDRSIDIQAEVRKLMAEDPSLTIVTATPLLREKFPHLFKRLSELSGPLLASPPETTRVPEEMLIGSTFNP